MAKNQSVNLVSKGKQSADAKLLAALRNGLPLDASTKMVTLRINSGGNHTRPSVSVTTRVSVARGYEDRVPSAQKALEKYLGS